MIVALFGAVIAYTAPGGHVRPVFLRPACRRLHLAFCCGWLPVGIYLLVRYYSWSWWYYLREDDFRVLLTVLPLLLEYMTSLAAFVLVGEALAHGRRKLAQGLIAGLAVLTGLLVVLPWERFLYIGSYEAWAAGDAPRMWSTPGLWLEWSLIGALITVTYGGAIWANLRGAAETT